MAHQSPNLEPTSGQQSVTQSAQTVDSIPESQPADKITQIPTKQPVLAPKATYAEKTNRIQAWSQFIKLVAPFVWVTVILIVIVPLLGRGFIAKSLSGDAGNLSVKSSDIVVIDKKIIDYSQIEGAIATALKDAHANAEHFASQRLDEWVDELMTRVDGSFLDWYFNYFTQKKLEFTAPFVWLSSAVAYRIDTNTLPPGQKVAENLTAEFQSEFAKRVLRPKIAQLKLERITRETINLYIAELGNNLSKIQSSYKIPQGQWERYLSDIAITINDTEGNISNISLKVLVGGSTYLIAKAMIPIVTKVGSKMAVVFAGKATAKMAAKTGGVVAGKIGAEFLDPIVGIGILIWDLWDYHHTIAVERPILRTAILDYLKEVKASLLDNPDNGVMTVIYQLESGIVKSV